MNYSTSPQTISLLNTSTNSIQNTSQIPTLIPTTNFYTISTDSSNIFQTLSTSTPQSASLNQIQANIFTPTTISTVANESNGKATTIKANLSQLTSDNSFKM